MKNEKIINAWNKIEPSDETKQRIFNDVMQKRQQKKYVNFKPIKILATAAAVVFIVGLINIQTVIGMINKLFFVSGIGFTESNIINEGIDSPIGIETEYGLITLKFVNKITKDGRTDLGLYLYSLDIPAPKARDNYPLYISITADGENIVSDAKVEGGGGWGSDGRNYVSYTYIHKHFPDITEFDLTILGVETHISLSYQPGNFALSKENNGVIMAVSKFNGVTDVLSTGIFDVSESAKDYSLSGIFWDPNFKGCDENGEAIRWTNGWGGYDFTSPLNYQIIEFYKNEKDIKIITADAIRIDYRRNEPLAVEIPVPKDGETIKTNIEIPIGNHTFRITSLRREGNTIYYENNSCEYITERGKKGGYSASTGYVGYESPEREQAVINCESIIESVRFYQYKDRFNPEEYDPNKPEMGGGEIWNFDENAETLIFYFADATILQYGDFNITFD